MQAPPLLQRSMTGDLRRASIKSGVSLGASLTLTLSPPPTGEDELHPRVAAVLQGTPVAAPLLLACPAFPLLVVHVLLNRSKLLCETVEAPLRSLAEDDALGVGRTLNAKLRTAKRGPKAAVGGWIAAFPALAECDALPWFRPCLEAVAQELARRRGSLVYKVRLFLGAGISVVDQLSDFYMIGEYERTGQHATAVALAAMVSLNLLGQLAVVWAQTHKGPKLQLVKESLVVVTATKPGLDAWRVARGVEQSK
jgi:hypothetical protein